MKMFLTFDIYDRRCLMLESIKILNVNSGIKKLKVQLRLQIKIWTKIILVPLTLPLAIKEATRARVTIF